VLIDPDPAANTSYIWNGNAWAVSFDRLTFALGNGSGFQQAGAHAELRSIQDKLRELSLSPTDFSNPSIANGSATADASLLAAIEQANTTGQQITIPAGQYKLAGNTTFPIDLGRFSLVGEGDVTFDCSAFTGSNVFQVYSSERAGSDAWNEHQARAIAALSRRQTMRRHGVVLALLATVVPSFAAHAVDIHITGAVTTPGLKQLPGHARLSDAALASPLRADAYVLGASWQRASLQIEQLRLKTGLLFDLESAHRQALRDDLPDLASSIAALREWLQPMPVTGRQVALLDPRSVEVNPAENRLVMDGDALYYPTRPNTIRVVGAVEQSCELPLVPLQDARNYLHACKPSRVADGDWIFVIQPDGRFVKQGVGLWNPGHVMPLAPGALIYVPLRETGLHKVPSDLNEELAAFLATQPISTTEDHR